QATPRPIRPLPSIRTDGMPRSASWAARIGPDAPPPTIATALRRSDFVVRPVLRICGTRFAALNMIVDPSHRSSAGFGKPPRHGRVHEHCQARADELAADLHRASTVPRPGHSKRTGVIEEQPVHRAAAEVLLAC